jgi:hypothetical protein
LAMLSVRSFDSAANCCQGSNPVWPIDYATVARTAPPINFFPVMII